MDNNCSICLKPIHKKIDKWNRLHLGKSVIKKKKTVTVLECSHVYHQKCIKEWFKQSTKCPLCRK